MSRYIAAVLLMVGCAVFIENGKQNGCALAGNLEKKKANATGPANKKQSEKMGKAEDNKLPLGITSEMPMNEVELVYGFYSSKTGAGEQEITIRADGTVKLYHSRTYDDPDPKIIEKQCNSENAIRLFDLLEGKGFYGLPDEYSSNTQSYARRLLKFTMPGREKIVAVDEPGNYAIEQCIGAIMLCAGMCIPEALNQRFFPNL